MPLLWFVEQSVQGEGPPGPHESPPGPQNPAGASSQALSRQLSGTLQEPQEPQAPTLRESARRKERRRPCPCRSAGTQATGPRAKT